MPITDYELLLAANIEGVNFKVAAAIAGGLKPIGAPMDFEGVIVQGVGNDGGSVTEYNLLQGDSAEQLAIRTREAVDGGMQPLGGPRILGGRYAQAVVLGNPGEGPVGGTSYELLSAGNPEQLSVKVNAAILAGKQPFGNPASLNGLFVQAVVDGIEGGPAGDVTYNVGDEIYLADANGQAIEGTIEDGEEVSGPGTFIALAGSQGRVAPFGTACPLGLEAGGDPPNWSSAAAFRLVGGQLGAYLTFYSALVQDGDVINIGGTDYTFAVADNVITSLTPAP